MSVPTTALPFKGLVESTQGELGARENFYQTFLDCPLPSGELLSNLGLFLNRQTLSRFLFMHHLYQQILDVHGIIAEFGVRWGQNMALFSNFRGIYEPFNYTRKIVGFDTFAGFPGVSAEDGKAIFMEQGAYGVTDGYERYLEKVLAYHQSESPIPHKKKFELVKGDATEQIDRYLDENPATIIALAYFDFDLYAPTAKCLTRIQEHLTKGSILAFDEVGVGEFPGETLALKEVLGLQYAKLRRVPYSPMTSYMIVGDDT